MWVKNKWLTETEINNLIKKLESELSGIKSRMDVECEYAYQAGFDEGYKEGYEEGYNEVCKD